MKAELEFITPALARQLLDQNPKNRNLSESAVRRFADDMRNGRWLNNGQTIVISESGGLLDGQHRCAAVLASQVTIPAFVVRGAPDTVFSTIDTGRARTVADLLHIAGYKNTTQLQSAASFARGYAAGASVGYQSTKAAVFDFVKAHPYLVDAVHAAAGAKRFARSPLMAVMFLANEGRKYDFEVSQFIDGVSHGDNLAKGDPRHTVREWYLGRSGRRDQVVPSRIVFAATARAWSAWAKGEALSAIRPSVAITREWCPIVGFDQSLYADLPDLSLETRLEKSLETIRKIDTTRFKPKTPTPDASAPPQTAGL